jgi:predicted O-methyltransferase YrrM
MVLRLHREIKEMLLDIRRKYLSFRYQFDVPPYDGMMNEAKCRFLYGIVTHYNGPKGNIVEIGSWKGCSTTWLAVAGRRKRFKSLIAVDLFTGTPSWNQQVDTYEIFMGRMRRNKLERFVRQVRSDSKEAAKNWDRRDTISVLHIDGDHAYEAVKADINNYMPYVEPQGVIIVDDYDSMHPGVQKAVDEFIKKGNLRVIGKVREIPGKGFGSLALRKSY